MQLSISGLPQWLVAVTIDGKTTHQQIGASSAALLRKQFGHADRVKIDPVMKGSEK